MVWNFKTQFNYHSKYLFIYFQIKHIGGYLIVNNLAIQFRSPTENKIILITKLIYEVTIKYCVVFTFTNATSSICIVILNNAKFYCPFVSQYCYIVQTDVKLVYKNT